MVEDAGGLDGRLLAVFARGDSMTIVRKQNSLSPRPTQIHTTRDHRRAKLAVGAVHRRESRLFGRPAADDPRVPGDHLAPAWFSRRERLNERRQEIARR